MRRSGKRDRKSPVAHQNPTASATCVKQQQSGLTQFLLGDEPWGSRSERISSTKLMCCGPSAGRPAAHSARSRRLSMSRASRSSSSRRYSCKDSPRVLASTESVRRVDSETPRICRATTGASCHPQSQPAGGLNWRSSSLPNDTICVRRTPGTAAPPRGISPYRARIRPTQN
jgi:hypothetical protein